MSARGELSWRQWGLLIALEWATNGIAFVGILLITYGFLAEVTHEKWAILDLVLVERWASVCGTLLGTTLVAASIWFYSHLAAPPERKSFVSATVVIVCCVVAFSLFIYWGRLPDSMVNGFGLLGLAGSLFRLRPIRPREENEELLQRAVADAGNRARLHDQHPERSG